MSYGGQVAYTVPVGAFNLRTQANYSYHDDYPQLFLLGPAFTNPAYWLANASLSVSPAKGQWDLSLWVHNATNERYSLTRNFFLPGTNVAAPGQPTTVGLRLKWSI